MQFIVLVIVFIACLYALFAIADMVFEDQSTVFDDHIFALIQPFRNSSGIRLMEIITFFGSAKFLLPANILLAGTFLFIKRQRLYSAKIAVVSITSTAVMFLLKDILKRQRPMVPVIAKVHGYSFPSGHSFSSLVFFGMLAYIAFQTIRNRFLKWSLVITCFAFALLIGFSRVYLKVHYPSDVIAGFCLGIIWLLLAKWLLVKTENVTESISPEI
ncbi:MAG: phosphatase PAP2 family protein [Ferruginibacter sp.]